MEVIMHTAGLFERGLLWILVLAKRHIYINGCEGWLM